MRPSFTWYGLLLMIQAFFGVAHAASKDARQTHVLWLENDTRLFSLHDNSDRFYTNGWRYGTVWTSDDSKDLPKFVATLAEWLPFAGALNDIAMDSPTLQAVAINVGQNMYTPSDIDEIALIPTDRPYAGWLYVGIARHAYVVRNDWPKQPPNYQSLGRVYSIELDLGMVGPGSGAKQFQTRWHKIIGIHKPRGWANQIENEPGVLLLYDMRWKGHEYVTDKGQRLFDLATHVGAAAGNVFTHVRASTTLRLGANLSDDFGPGARIDAAQPRAGVTERRPALEFYVFGRSEGRGVVHNIFIEGNTFANSHGVEPRRFVADLEWGWSLRYRSLRLTHRQVHRSPEFQGQASQQIFGSVMLSLEPGPRAR